MYRCWELAEFAVEVRGFAERPSHFIEFLDALEISDF